MFIINQDRNVVVNTDHIISIYVDDTKVSAKTSVGYTVLGIYDHRENRADEVFKEMLENIFIPNLIVINTTIPDDFAEKFKKWPTMPWGVSFAGEHVDIKTIERAAYYMPEE